MPLSDEDDTKDVILAGLRAALQARIVSIWNNVTLTGEPKAEARFKEGVTNSAKYYRLAVKAVKELDPE